MKNTPYKCQKCRKELKDNEVYEYRGAYACDDHFDEVCEMRDEERKQIIREETAKTEPLKGLDLSSSTVIGKANRELLKEKIEIASTESVRIKKYEGRDE